METMTRKEIERFLHDARICRLGMAVKNEPYVVPVAFAYKNGKIYIHSAPCGKKVELLRKNSRVCFEIDEYKKDGSWRSVIAFGELTLHTDAETICEALNALSAAFREVRQDEREVREGAPFRGRKRKSKDVAKMGVCVGVLEPETITGRKSTGH